MKKTSVSDREFLEYLAQRVMIEKGLDPFWPSPLLQELSGIKKLEFTPTDSLRDLRNLPWCSIDNNDSRDLDQLTVWRKSDGGWEILVAIADVDALVKKDSVLDVHAGVNTTSVYTVAKTFPMLPEKISTDLTSLGFGEDRLAVVVQFLVDDRGMVGGTDLYRAWVRNQAKLTYAGVGLWLETGDSLPPGLASLPEVAENLKQQNQAAQKLKTRRFSKGALGLETGQDRLAFQGDELQGFEPDPKNVARELIEEFMVAANGVTAKFLANHHAPTIARVVRSPRKWERIVELAAELGFNLPKEPNSPDLEVFLAEAKVLDLQGFPDLCLSIIKLLGPGEYAVQIPGESALGHFNLGMKEYVHSTAPNRRYPDLITQRILKAVLSGENFPYTPEALEILALHCTAAEDLARKVERTIFKSAVAALLENRIGETFQALITGTTHTGVWVKIESPPVEGRLVEGFEGKKVGQKIKVQLVSVDKEKGFIDFKN